MQFLETLTVIFILLKYRNVIAWSWWLVLLPGSVAIVFQIIATILDCLYIKRMSTDIKQMSVELRRKENE